MSPAFVILRAIERGAPSAFIRTIAAFAIATAVCAPDAARAAPVKLKACTVGRAKLPAQCGTLRVYEDRATRRGRTILLHFIEIDAVHPSRRAIFWNPGGPGGDDLSAVPFIADGLGEKELVGLRDRYNLVFIDNRGTGLSHPIKCNLYSPQHSVWYFRQEFPDGPLRACRAAQTAHTDLRFYATDIAADDLDDVRAALHFPKIVLDGGSYGTMFFLDYARRHPSHVESLVLQGVAPPGILLIPLEDAQGAQHAMNDLIADCARDAACRERFPHLRQHFAALVARFDKGSLQIPAREAPANAGRDGLLLSKEVFVDRLRQTLYSADAAAYVPYIVEQAYHENYAPLAKLVDTVTQGLSDVGIGLNLTVTCAEDLPFISDAQIRRTSAQSFEGDLRVRAQQRACAVWNVPPVDPSFVVPVRSSAPILMLSGTEDPATPPEYGRAALRYLPNARQVLIPYAGHDTESACTDALIVAFVHTQDARHLDASKCIGTARRPPFATSMKGFGSG